MELPRKKHKKTAIIAGRILDEATGKAVSGAILQLYKEQANNPEVLKDLTYSNKYGFFTIETESRGAYVLRVSALGYEQKDQLVSVTDMEKVVISNINILRKDNELTSKIVGQITDQDKKIIPLAEVILYRVTEYGGMIPVGYQKSDESGYYEFDHVPKGTYKVSLSAPQKIK